MASSSERRILKDETYLITSHDTTRQKELNASQLAEAFRVAGVRKGIRVIPSPLQRPAGVEIANIRVDRDVTFRHFEEVVQEVANKTGYLVFVDVGTIYSSHDEEKNKKLAADARRNPILAALPGRN